MKPVERVIYLTLRRTDPIIVRRCLGLAELDRDIEHVWLDTGGTKAKPRFYSTQFAVAHRLKLLVVGIVRVGRMLSSIGGDALLYTSNVDSLFVALAASRLFSGRARIACEVHDVHGYFLDGSPFGALSRLVLSRLLASTDLLIVPSQGNIDEFYRPLARFRGTHAIVQNKIATAEFAGRTPPPPFLGTWVIGWFCGLRCRRTLHIIGSAARALGPRVRFELAGVDQFDPGELRAFLAAHPNVEYFGEYRTQSDIAGLYSRVHFGLALHFVPPRKAEWALPVRLFESGAYGRPVFARAGTAAGEFVRDNRVGLAVDEPCEDRLTAYLESLTPEVYRDTVRDLNEGDLSLFVGEDQLRSALAVVRASAD